MISRLIFLKTTRPPKAIERFLTLRIASGLEFILSSTKLTFSFPALMQPVKPDGKKAVSTASESRNRI
jgi:hypothetical protein